MFYKTLAIKKIKFILFIILCGLSTSSHSEVTKLMLFNTDGIEQSMSDYIGRNKWVLVNVWSPSCSFCVQELPKVSLFKYGRIEIIKAFLMKYPQNYPIFLADINQVSDLIGMRLVGIPLIALFNPEGKPVARWPGEIEINEIEKFITDYKENNDPLSSEFD